MDNSTKHQPIEKQEGLLHRIANRIRQSLELQEILNTTATEIRDYLKTDRVKVYRFNPDGNGVVIAESIERDRLPSLLGLHFPADDIPPMARDLFLRARQRSVVDVANHQISFVPPDTDAAEGKDDHHHSDHHHSENRHSENHSQEDSQELRYRPIDPCHAEYLNAMGVKSSIVVPIVLEEGSTGQPRSLSADSASAAQLWGLLACHHSQPRDVSETELQFVQAVVDQVSVAIAQSHLLEQVRTQAEQEANINRITQILRTNTTVELQLALEEAVATFQGSGGRLYLLPSESQPKELHTCGEQPAFIDKAQTRTIEENYLWKNFIHSSVESAETEGHHKPWSVQWMRSAYSLKSEQSAIGRYPELWPIADLYREPLFRTLTPSFEGTAIRSLVIIPLHHGPYVVGCLTIFRNEVDTEILWAGYHTPDTRQLMPRQSFEVWKQEKKGAGQVWTEAEIKYAQALSVRFSTAVKQYRLYQQVRALNANLEAQVIERTEQLQQKTQQLQQSHQELEKSFSRQAALVSIVSKIRESLDIEEIFRVMTQDLRQLMTVDQVHVHQFSTDWEKRCTENAECIIPFLSFQLTNPKLAEPYSADSVGQDGARLQADQVDQYQSREVLVIDDIHQHALSQDQLERYEQLQVKSLLSVPILVGQELWGCVGLYQQTPRHWESSEVEFTIQIAGQLGVALQHASLLARNHRKQAELSDTLKNLQETQAQLVQTEKMSSLGRLVAGVAHEINNPVNFIHANLSHLDEYSQNLFKVIASYQVHCPNPPQPVQTLLEETDVGYIEEDLPKLCASLSLGTARIREIVLSLRNFSRLDESTLKAVDLHEGIESTLLILQHRLKTNKSNVEIKVEKTYGNLPLVECYPGQINQVFMNLIVNAIDELQATESSLKTAPATEIALRESVVKTIAITTELISAERIRVSIKDDGKGIQPADMDKLFDPFFTTKPIGKGTGLGLSVSYKIIEAHAGKLRCQSKLGEGAEFVIELPVKSSSVGKTSARKA